MRHRRGARAIEYGLLAAMIALAIVLVLTTTGGNLTSTFGSVSSSL
jgi:pilus assembly protein Flp/PilA